MRAREFRGVALVVSVVLVEREFAAAARKEGQQDLFVVRIEILHRVAVHGQDGARTYVNRIFVQRESPLDGTSSVEHRSGLPLIPFPLGEPDLHGRIALLARRGDRRYEDVVAEEVLVAEGIGFRGLGPLVVHRPAERNPLVVGLAGHGVDIGCERITLADGAAQDVGMLRGEVPDLLFQSGALGRVGAHDGAQGAELHPADVKFGVDAVGHVVSSDVVAPISVEDVRGSGVEVGLEVERSPRDGGVARKSDLIAVVAQPAPAVVEHRAHIAALLHVAEKYVVEPPCVAQPLDGGVGGLLLPVEPPEIHPVTLHRRQDAAEDAADEFLVGRYPGYGLFRRGVDAHVAGYVGIAVLTASHAVGRMEVEGRADALPVEPPEELRRIGKERAVPRPAGPSSAVAVGVVPVHVDHQHVERDVVGAEILHQRAQLLVRIGPIAAPPIPEGVARRQGHLACKEREVAQGGFVVVSVGEEIPVLSAVVGALFDPFPLLVAVEEEVVRIVDERPAVGGQQSVLDGHFRTTLVVDVGVAVVSVQRAVGSFEVAFLLHARFPDEGHGGSLRGAHREVRGRERTGILPVAQDHLRRGDFDPRAPLHAVVRGGICSLDGHERLRVDELSVGGVFHAHGPVRDDREADMIVRIGDVLVQVLGLRRLHRAETKQ